MSEGPAAADILIAGGYGVVGRRIAALLAPGFRGRVVDAFALVVTVDTGGHEMRVGLAGTHQADATPAGAAELARQLAVGEISASGVWLPEEAASPVRFFEQLAERGFRPSPL